MAKRKIKKENHLGRVQYVATCQQPKEVGSRQQCGEKFPGGDKSGDAHKAWNIHDRHVHKPQRDAAARAERDAKRQAAKDRKEALKEAKRARVNEEARSVREIAKDIARGKIKPKKGTWTTAEIAELRSKYGKAAAEAAKELSGTPVGHITPASGLRTKGIPHVKDGKNVNGIVYYDSGPNKGQRVPYDVLKRYVQGWE